MRIAVAAQGMDLTSKVDPRFGRASHFVVYDTRSEKSEVITNSPNANAEQGAGIQAAESVAGARADMVVAGNFGPKAFQALAAAGATMARWADGTVADAVELARAGKLEICEQANVDGHGK